MVTVRPYGVARRSLAALVATLAAAGLLVAVQASAAPEAQADTAPPTASGFPATFSADPLPTVQTDGVVWANTTIAKTKTSYATGNFDYVRPAGMAPSATRTGQTRVGGIVAFNITTGVQVPLTTLRPPTLNASGYAIAVSPDGSTVYVGGSFTTANGVAHAGIAAFNAATGAIDTAFTAQVPGQVNAIVATKTAVYIGGKFLSADGVARTRLAALDPVSGALLGWAPTANNTVSAMVLTPDASRLIIGGSFSTVDGAGAYGSASVDAHSGATEAWAINKLIRDYNTGAGIDTLSTDGTNIYGGGFAFTSATENFEGRFAANPTTGAIVWADDCHGDTYATLPVNGALYSTSHDHDCSEIGSFPNAYPASEPWHRTLAETLSPTGGVNGDDPRGGAWNAVEGLPTASVLDWFPVMTPSPEYASQAVPGTVSTSGADEAGWDLSSNGNYLVVGGEMSAAGDPGSASYLSAQQGLVRYGVRSLAPNKVGPRGLSTPTITAGTTPGTALVSFGTAWDRDNQYLTYSFYRDGSTAPVYTTTVGSTFWTLPTASFTDTGLAAGVHHYTLKISDPTGNTVSVASVAVTIATAAPAGAGAGSVKSSALVYSTDGSKTWTTAPLVAAGKTVLVREYDNNATAANISGASLSTSLPAGFTRVAGSTVVCAAPGTQSVSVPAASPVCDTSTGQGGAITESAVWSGSKLTISPTAGLDGQPTNQTAGPLPIGRKAYLNLQSCEYLNVAKNNYEALTASDGPAYAIGTNASNTADASATCGPGNGFKLHLTAALNLSLTAKKYLNLEQCEYSNGTYETLMVGEQGAAYAVGTNTANTANTTASCGPGAGFRLRTSSVTALDLLDNRYVNLESCEYNNSVTYEAFGITAYGPYTTGTSATTTPGTIGACGIGTAVWALDKTMVNTIDTLDTSRGQGYVQFTMTAPTKTTTSTQTATMTASGATTQATTAAIKVS